MLMRRSTAIHCLDCHHSWRPCCTMRAVIDHHYINKGGAWRIVLFCSVLVVLVRYLGRSTTAAISGHFEAFSGVCIPIVSAQRAYPNVPRQYYGFLTDPGFAVAVNTDADNSLYSGMVRPNGFVEGVYVFVDQILKREKGLVIDVGGNFGAVSIFSAKLGSKVIAIEGNPATAEYFRHNILFNCVHDYVQLIQSLVSDKEEDVFLDTPAISGQVSINKAGGDSGQGVRLKAASLDKLLSGVTERPLLLKMDIEGFELQALRGATMLLRERPPKYVVWEMAPTIVGKHVALEQMNILMRAGYSLYLLGTQAHHGADPGHWARWLERPIRDAAVFLDETQILSFDVVAVHKLLR